MKDKILSILFCLILFSFFIINLIIKDNDISYTERRKMQSFPKINTSTLLSGKWMKEFDDYTLDQFAFRESFRSLKANIEINLFKKLDNNNIFIKDGYIYKIEYPLDERKVNSFVYKINTLYETYLKDMNVYYTIIPDKNYYLSDNYLKMDYDKLFSIVTNNLDNDMTYIDIKDCLTLDDYYYTDTHWKQNKISKVVDKLSNKMNFKVSNNYKEKTYYPFYGVYYGQAALKVKPDTINYLTNDIIESATVKDEESDLKTVYEESSLGGMDSYDVFLSGSTPFITIENSKYNGNKELIIFRDSFASTLAPLLIEGYSKITLIDLRYMNPSDLEKKVEFKNQDVLIIHNTLVINNSEAIRI